nr:PREDICTED: golgin subfamily A member 7 [Opisthocomus hoazin]
MGELTVMAPRADTWHQAATEPQHPLPGSQDRGKQGGTKRTPELTAGEPRWPLALEKGQNRFLPAQEEDAGRSSRAAKQHETEREVVLARGRALEASQDAEMTLPGLKNQKMSREAVSVLYIRERPQSLFRGTKTICVDRKRDSFQIDRQQFEETVRTLNNLYAEAEKLGGQSYLEGCLACLTAYTIFLCMETHYEKVLKKIAKFIQEQNEKIYAPQGLLLTDPIERGLRVIEITIYEDRGMTSGR